MGAGRACRDGRRLAPHPAASLLGPLSLQLLPPNQRAAAFPVLASRVALQNLQHVVIDVYRSSFAARFAVASAGRLSLAPRNRPSTLHRFLLHIKKFQVPAGSGISFFHISISRTRAQRYPTHRGSSHRCPSISPASSHAQTAMRILFPRTVDVRIVQASFRAY